MNRKSKSLASNGIEANPTCAFEWISPEIATDWMENHNNLNRKFRKSLEEKYSRDIINDQWITTGESISFDYNGEMIDGQHTCASVIRSGITIYHLVVRGLHPKARKVTNIGAPRTPADILKLEGWDATPWSVAIVRQMMNGANRRASIPEIVDSYSIYEQAARAVMAMFPNKRRLITLSPVLAPMAKAWYTSDEALLQRFADILYNGMASKSKKADYSVILLRDFLLQLPYGRGGDSTSREIYALASASLDAFLNNIKLSKLEPAKEELFPIPESIEKKRKKRNGSQLKVAA